MKDLPQSERSEHLKELLFWIAAKSKKNGASTRAILDHVTEELTSMGATLRTARSYLRTLERAKFIYTDKLKWKITDKGENWLERKYNT